MKKRIISGIVAALALLGIIFFFGYDGVSVLAFAIATLALYEFSTLAVDASVTTNEGRVLFIILGLLLYVISIVYNQYMLPALIFTLLGLFTFFLVKVWMGKSSSKEALDQLAMMQLGILYAGLLPVYLALLMKIEGNGAGWLLGILSIVFVGDTGAYFAGKRFGKHKLAPNVSPGKTIEGSIGGLVGSVVGILIVKVILLPELPIYHCFIMGIVGGAIAQIGDLCESLLKRAFNKKDSGKIMPGHGGVLDRCDGLLFGAPFLYYYVNHIVL